MRPMLGLRILSVLCIDTLYLSGILSTYHRFISSFLQETRAMLPNLPTIPFNA